MTTEMVKEDFSKEAFKALEALEGASEANTKKINDFLNSQEEKNQKLVLELKESEKSKKDLEERLNNFEAELKRNPLSGDEKSEAKKQLKSFEKYVLSGAKNLEEGDKKYLRTDIQTSGGYLVPIAQESEIIKQITEISPIRQLARVRTMPAKAMTMPKRTALLSAGWSGEGEIFTESQSTYGSEMLTAHKLAVTVRITNELLQDASPNMINEINQDVAEKFAQLEGAAFINGDSNNKPEGVLTNSDIAETNSGSASQITFDSLIEMTGEVKTGYNPVYGFNRKTLAAIRSLKDGNGNYIWRMGNLGAGIPNSINGVPYFEMPDMPDIAADAFPVIYGDFSRGYVIGDRLGVTVIRDDVTNATKDEVIFTFRKRLDGQVILPEAFNKLKIAV